MNLLLKMVYLSKYSLTFLIMKALSSLAIFLVVVGALNWGLVGIGSFVGMDLNLVNLALGSIPTLENVVYILVGVSGLMVGFAHMTKKCHM